MDDYCTKEDVAERLTFTKCPFTLPPPEKSLEDRVEQLLRCPEKLSIHSLDSSQRFFPTESTTENLYSMEVSSPNTDITMERDLCTGRLIGFSEENLDTHGDLELCRKPKFYNNIRGNNIPFQPGGFDVQDKGHNLQLPTNELLDFENDLLTVPPGFSTGINFPSLSANSAASSTSKNKALSNTKSDTEVSMKLDEDGRVMVKNSLGDLKYTSMRLPREIPPEDSNLVKVVSTPRTDEWVEILDCSQPVSDFHARIPSMAHTWPFELDTFQKRAILCLENSDNVFVAAHTSAGKTVVAEYAIALSLRHLTRTIYTSPIKALSNQKFRDFRVTFGSNNIGLVTGDVQINCSASCLIMTTEILRSMLYNGSEVIRDLEWVIFDEVHYINDSERGVVWEEVLIMLPKHISIVLLSATVPNTREFASWVGKTKRKKIYIVSTTKRPVPLEHYLYTGNSDKSSNELFLVVDADGRFLTREYAKAEAAKRSRDTKASTSTGRRGHRDGLPQQERTTWLSLIRMLERTDRLPAVAFVFSKKKIEDNTYNLTSVDLTTNREKSSIERFFHRCIQRLTPLDQLLPQVISMNDLLKRGLGIHHSGVLPILKEIVELLFQQGLVKLLFATETFAMGVNMPARTVLFDSMNKHDGTSLRPLRTGEYIQMAGRAGRRGLDLTGTVIILCKGDVLKSPDLHNMILGKPTKLQSQFRLTYSMILNLCRVKKLRMEDMMKRSFTEFHAQNDQSKHRSEVSAVQQRLSDLEEIDCIMCNSDIEQYYLASREYCDLRDSLHGTVMNQAVMLHSLESGRVVVLQLDNYTEAIAVLLSIRKHQPHESPLCTVFALCDPRIYPSLNIDELESLKTATSVPPIVKRELHRPPAEQAWHRIFICQKQHIAAITPKIVRVDSDAILADINKRQQIRFRECLPSYSVTSACQELVQYLHENPDSLPVLDPVKDLKIRDIDLVEQFRTLKMTGREFSNYNCINCSQFNSHFEEMHKQQLLKSKYNHLKFLLSEDSLSLLPDYDRRVQVLKRLDYINSDGAIQLKGRVACEQNASTLLLTEIIFENVLEGLTPSEIAAALSCVVFQEHRCSEPNLTEKLLSAQQHICSIVEHIASIQYECRVQQELGDHDLDTNFGLIEVVYEWARGLPFKDITELTSVQEGVIVRTIQRLHEVLCDIKDAARLIGNPILYQKMAESSNLIKRDIVFAASLYTQQDMDSSS